MPTWAGSAGHLEGGDAHERHNFPVFATAAEGVKEYGFWFTHLIRYKSIAAKAKGDWRAACNLIERSGWSSSGYGGTLDVTAAACHIALVRTLARTPLFRDPNRRRPPVIVAPAGELLALSAAVTGQVVAGKSTWYRIRFGAGDGRVLYAHTATVDPTTV